MINDAVAIVVFEIMNSAEVAQNGKRPMCFFFFQRKFVDVDVTLVVGSFMYTGVWR